MKVAMPEWLRGLTRNQMRSPRVGSNPTGDELFSFYSIFILKIAVDASWLSWLERQSHNLEVVSSILTGGRWINFFVINFGDEDLNS